MTVNQWGNVVLKRWKDRNNVEGEWNIQTEEWECSLGWCRSTKWMWEGLENTNSSHKIRYHPLGYIVWEEINASPCFVEISRDYQCEGVFCKLLEESEQKRCNQSDGIGGRVRTQYIWSGHQAKIHEYHYSTGWRNYLKKEGTGWIILSEYGQVLRKQMTYLNGHSSREEYTYQCD